MSEMLTHTTTPGRCRSCAGVRTRRGRDDAMCPRGMLSIRATSGDHTPRVDQALGVANPVRTFAPFIVNAYTFATVTTRVLIVPGHRRIIVKPRLRRQDVVNIENVVRHDDAPPDCAPRPSCLQSPRCCR